MGFSVTFSLEGAFIYQAIHYRHNGGIRNPSAILESAENISHAAARLVFPQDFENFFFKRAKCQWSRHVSAIIITLIRKILESNRMSAVPLPLPVSVVEVSLRQALSQTVSRLGGSIAPDKIPLEHPAIETQGDWATPLALQVFGQRQSWPDSPIAQARSPRDVADSLVKIFQEVIAEDTEISQFVERLEVAGPGFLNIILSTAFWQTVSSEILTQKDSYGRHTIWQNQVWEVEHSSPNPNKAMHLGHLRNNITGMAMTNIWEAMGVKVIREAVDNNRGISIAKLMWGYLKFGRKSESTPIDLTYWRTHPDEWHTPASAGLQPDRFMDGLYVEAAQDCETNPETEALVRSWVVAWEAKDPDQWALWQKVLDYVYEGQNLTLKRLHNHFDRVWHEHEHYEAGKDLVQEGLEKGIFRKLEDGAILTNLKAFGLSDTLVQKRDGTALYITQDLALTKLKKEVTKADRMVWVVGPEQSLAMQQLFAVCEQLGIGSRDSFEHLSYGYLSIRGGGKMSSRKGNTIFIDDLIDQARDSIKLKMESDHLQADEKDAVAELLAESAVKYAILKVGRTTDIQFDLATSISLEGDSGPYIQYTHARCRSILRQADAEARAKISTEALEPAEVALARWLSRFPAVVAGAASQSAPNLLAQYLYELAQRFNAFYGQVSVLQAETLELKSQRLATVAAVAQVLKTGASLLGFAVVEKM